MIYMQLIIPTRMPFDWSQAGRNLIPITKWIGAYNKEKLQADAIAGATVGLMVVPQALAYASVAG